VNSAFYQLLVGGMPASALSSSTWWVSAACLEPPVPRSLVDEINSHKFLLSSNY
jgi:hypothetical protein